MGALLNGGAGCTPHFVPGGPHFKNKFCDNCRAPDNFIVARRGARPGVRRYASIQSCKAGGASAHFNVPRRAVAVEDTEVARRGHTGTDSRVPRMHTHNTLW